jgi:hypothetical protein
MAFDEKNEVAKKRKRAPLRLLLIDFLMVQIL